MYALIQNLNQNGSHFCKWPPFWFLKQSTELRYINVKCGACTQKYTYFPLCEIASAFRNMSDDGCLLFSCRPSICSCERHLLRQRDLCEFRVGSSSGHRGSQRPAVQRAVSEVLQGRTLRGLCFLSRRRRREGRWRGEHRSCWRWSGGAFGDSEREVHSSAERPYRALGDGAQPGGSHQLLLPHRGHKRSDSPE